MRKKKECKYIGCIAIVEIKDASTDNGEIKCLPKQPFEVFFPSRFIAISYWPIDNIYWICSYTIQMMRIASQLLYCRNNWVIVSSCDSYLFIIIIYNSISIEVYLELHEEIKFDNWLSRFLIFNFRLFSRKM